MRHKSILVMVIIILGVGSQLFAGSIVGWGRGKTPDGNDFVAIAAGSGVV